MNHVGACGEQRPPSHNQKVVWEVSMETTKDLLRFLIQTGRHSYFFFLKKKCHPLSNSDVPNIVQGYYTYTRIWQHCTQLPALCLVRFYDSFTWPLWDNEFSLIFKEISLFSMNTRKVLAGRHLGGLCREFEHDKSR